MSVPDGYNFVKWAREIAETSWEWEKRSALKDASDTLQDAIKQFERTWAQDDLRTLNGAWARCHVAIDAIKPSGGSDPVGGRLREQKVATG